MSEIVDNGRFWKLVINPDLKPVELIDELDSKGFTARLGHDVENDKYLVMDVNYAKDKFTLDNISKFAEQGSTCSRCDTLNKEKMKLDKISLRQVDSESPRVAPQITPSNTVVTTTFGTTNLSDLKKPGAVKDLLAQTFFNAYFTNPALYFFASMMGDDALLNQVLPKTQEEMDKFMDEMMGFFSGEIDFLRSPEDAKEYFSAIRRPKNEEDIPVRSMKRVNKGLPFSGTVVY